MSLVDTSTSGLCRSLVLEDVFLGWVPESGVIDRRHIEVLSNACDPGRQTLLASMVVWCDERDLLTLARVGTITTFMTDLDLRIVRNGRLAVASW